MDRWRDRYEWDYYSESRPRKVDGGIKAKSERGSIGETWWSKRWVKVLESMGMGTRLTRGRSYARMGQVLSLEIEPGIVRAKVQGSMRQPYKIKIKVDPLSDREWEKVTEAMAAQAIFAAKLLAGEMPTNIEEAFESVHLSLFPTDEDDLDTDCSCPDWANPCKHIAATYYIMAERFDEDPFLIFTLRGRTKEEIIKALREKRAAPAPAEKTTATGQQTEVVNALPPLRLEDNIATFWQAGEGLDTFALHPEPPKIAKAVLKRLGDAPFSIGGKNVAVLLEKAYDVVSEAVVNVGGESEEP